jgi:four helix bundle protein
MGIFPVEFFALSPTPWVEERMMPTTSFTQLEVWQKARQLTRDIYRLTERFPRHELFSLTAQTQRAVLSIGANIAEGYGRRTPRGKAHCYSMSKSSGDELLHYLIISEDLGYHKGEPGLVQMVNSICAMLVRLTQTTLTNFR